MRAPAVRGDESNAGPAHSALRERFDLRLLAVLLSIDAILIGAHVATGLLLPKIPTWLNIAQDRSLPEFTCYAVMLAGAVVMWRAWRRTGLALCVSFAAALLLMMLDDSLQLHESLGAHEARVLGLGDFAGIEADHGGELIAWGILGIVLAVAGLFGLVRTPLNEWRQFYLLTALVGLLGFFAVGIDVLHDPVCAVAAGRGHCAQIFDLVEDGGEMVVQSFILAHVVAAFGARPTRT